MRCALSDLKRGLSMQWYLFISVTRMHLCITKQMGDQARELRGEGGALCVEMGFYADISLK